MGAEDLMPPGFPAPGFGPGPPGLGGMPGGRTGDLPPCGMPHWPIFNERGLTPRGLLV